MPAPRVPPIGLELANTAKIVSRAFDDALIAAGTTRPTWSILLALKSRQVANQLELAAAVGIQGATLSHHLNAMETFGLLRRRRDPTNRRVHLVDVTAKGEATFARLRGAAVDFDRRLRAGLSESELARFSEILDRLAENATGRIIKTRRPEP